MYYRMNIHYKRRNWFVKKILLLLYSTIIKAHLLSLLLHYFSEALILIEFDLILQLFLLIFRLMYLKLNFLIKLFN